MKITVDMLKAANACSSQVELFEKHFPNGTPKTYKSAMRVALKYSDVFNWAWASRWLLSKSQRAEYGKVEAAAWAEYDKVEAAAWAEYNKAVGPACAEYDKVEAAARAEYDKATAAARAEYDKAVGPAWAEYNKARAAAFVNALFGSK